MGLEQAARQEVCASDRNSHAARPVPGRLPSFTRSEFLVLFLAVLLAAAIFFADMISQGLPGPLRSLQGQSGAHIKQLADVEHALDQSAIVATTDKAGIRTASTLGEHQRLHPLTNSFWTLSRR